MTHTAPLLARLLALILCLGLPLTARAQDNPFAGGWVLNSASSTFGFQSVKNDTKVEQNTFATLSGTIADDGTAEVRIALDSIDTKVDLRNVRMRFLFFETFKFPQSTITARLDPALIADLAIEDLRLARAGYAHRRDVAERSLWLAALDRLK